MKKIHLIGDSHTIMYKDDTYPGFGLPDIQTHHFGACTAHGLMSTKSVTQSFSTLARFMADHDPRKDMIFFGFGEIDCRVLIYHKSIEYNVTVGAMISIVIDRYFMAINLTRNYGYDVAVHGIVPAVLQENEYKIKNYAPLSIRADISERFNDQLALRCGEQRCDFYDFQNHNHSIMSTGKTMIEAFMLPDKVHVDPRKYPVGPSFKSWLFHHNYLCFTTTIYKEEQ